ncbi:MAG: UDP-N-acetylmuramoyl-tripeptide--D-alanyl-D-alanine ligase [Deltaproteobacteria bacterium]|nr:UDP-N-acetylmuramoyl-tripeptide--D-alanyl-D-alanine ligase [Deltaproteobacteria bacterium]
MGTPIPSNEAVFSLDEILAKTGASAQAAAPSSSLTVRGLSTDTRRLHEGQAFVALAGETFDGHDHLAAAAGAGAVLALVERPVTAPPGLPILEVSSTVKALAALAKTHLERWRRADPARRVVAITGSAGKTTTRGAVSALLRHLLSPDAIHETQGNLNNLIGVPMTVLGLGEAHRIAVLELATNQPGEIPQLASLVRPDVGLVTLIAQAHAEGLGSIEAIAQEKNALYDALSGGIAIGNADDPRVMAGMNRAVAAERIAYGQSDQADYRIVDRRLQSEGRSAVTIARPDGSLLVAELGLIGHAGALACAAALATAERLTGMLVDGAAVAAALGAIDGAGRLHPQATPSGAVVIDDSYNANPASCRSSIEAASELAASLGRRLVLVLGEMRELGEASAKAHDEVGAFAAERGASLVIAVAGDARRIAIQAAVGGVEKTCFVDDAVHGAEQTLAAVEPGDIVLVKGSRAVGTERVVAALVAGGGPDEGRTP